MKKNTLREILRAGKPTVATRIASSWPFITELAGQTGRYDYVEYLVEYAPFSPLDLENCARACELHGMGSIAKVDFQNRGYVAQKALASGIQGILFTDCLNAAEVEECIYLTMPGTPSDGGRFGYPYSRWIGCYPDIPQLDHASRVRDAVRLFMIEKKSAYDEIETICKLPGVDMIQFGPSDFSLSMGLNTSDNKIVWEAQDRCIRIAMENGVRPRVEIYSPEEARRFLDMGVKDFCIGDQVDGLINYWQGLGDGLASLMKE